MLFLLGKEIDMYPTHACNGERKNISASGKGKVIPLQARLCPEGR